MRATIGRSAVRGELAELSNRSGLAGNGDQASVTLNAKEQTRPSNLERQHRFREAMAQAKPRTRS